ncbi:MAG: cell surface protein SprA, partial [Bacteroidales bacterium]|nr:cell surface protein SprA [Bacteroidales bacterium]
MRFFTRVLSILLFAPLTVWLLQLTLVESVQATPIGITLFLSPPDSTNTDTTNNIQLLFPFTGDDNLLFLGGQNRSNFFLKDPKNLEQEIVYDPKTNQYIVTNKMGDLNYRPPQRLTMEEYRSYDEQESLKDYWTERSAATGTGAQGGIIPQIHIGGKVFDRIFGGNTIDIRPQGSAELLFGVVNNKREDPALNVRQQSVTNFDFQEKIQLNVLAKIGDKIEFKVNYNTESTFDFENKLKLKYEGDEDEIIKLIEAGDVTLPLTSTLIQGSQSLFGIKTKLQFGKLTVTSVFSQQKSETSSLTVQGGAQKNDFELRIDQYEENKHFFLAEYFRNSYESALAELPIITSNVNITKVEVWVTNIGAPTTNNRNILAMQDLGEFTPYNEIFEPKMGGLFPDNQSNDLRQVVDTNIIRDISSITNYLQGELGLVSGLDYEKVELARKLKPSEYSVNTKLGFISLNTRLNPDQVLAVSYQYTMIGESKIYQVGEFSDQGIIAPNTLMVKLLKSTSVNTNIPMWDLMMKNIYNIGAYQVNREDFMLNILFTGGEDGVPTGYLPKGNESIKGVPLLEVMNFDNLDQQSNPYADGIFDFVDNAALSGGTIQSSNGRIFFTMLEPFGEYLRRILDNEPLADEYCYDSLYRLTKSEAQQYPAKNKYLLEGSYKSSSGSEISLNALNVPQGSVKVTAGGIPLTENVDYTVDYTLGRVRIINEGILNSGTPINISMESNSAFNLQTKRMMGAHFDYEVNQNLHLGGTILNLSEKPITQKTNVGDDPINNTIWGVDMSYQKESRWITKMVDKLPLIETDARSLITLNGEFAHFLPGHSRAIGSSGTSYIDDFEGTKSTIDLKLVSRWVMASTPQGQTQLYMFPEAAISTGTKYGMNRAKLAWYIIDPLFYDQGNLRPANITSSELSKDEVRQVLEKEVFPNKETPNGYPTNIPVFNLAYYPNQKGPYNYDVDAQIGYTAGIDEFGNLIDPGSRWGGIMREIETSDFEATNVEYIEFWVMDPFGENEESNGGVLYFNIGDVSEDILRDSRKGFENGLPTSELIEGVDETIWGRVPALQSLVDAFDNQPESRPFQDVGFDGLRNEDERNFFQEEYLKLIGDKYGTTSLAYSQAIDDPSGDDFHYFRGTDFDNDAQYESILERYKRYNGPDGNSPVSQYSNESYSTTGTTRPDVEDINRDNTLSESERYFQYRIELHPDDMEVGNGYITDMREGDGRLTKENGDPIVTKWFQFKIPIRRPSKVVGNISDFKSIRFMRMFLKDFDEPTILRFATLELVRSDWRKYEYSLLSPGEFIPNDEQSGTIFETAAINIEENGNRTPIPYVLPPGIEREINIGTTNLQRQNEQAMQIYTCGLVDGDARAVFKTVDFDFRRYKRLKMFVHAEQTSNDNPIQDGDLTLFLRMGSDFTDNYYEYEVPLHLTDWGTSDPYAIWPESNSLDVELEKLVDVKLNRNIAERDNIDNISNSTPYSEMDGDNTITILGSPSLSDVRAIMIGIRNPKKQSFNDNDDGLDKCAEVWVNELRVSDFDNKSAWAATARAKIDLADFGNVIISGAKSTPGFGGLESKINDRQQDDITNFDFATNLQIGKFFPEEWGVKVPMHFDYSEASMTPEYNPLDPDINFDKDLESYASKSQKDSVKALSQDITIRKNINFINVRKDRTGNSITKQHFYDIENFDLSYSYSEIYHRNIDIDYYIKKTYRGGLGYNLALNPKPVEPLKKIKFFRAKSLRILRDFNFYYMPKLFSFRMDVNREYSEKKLRNKSTGDIPMRWNWTKTFDWNRTYNLKYDLTKGLKLEYSAQANSYVDEPQGRIDRGDSDYMNSYRDTVWSSIFSGGSMNQFDQSIAVNYSIPINKIRLLDWITANARYQGDYHWTASPQSLQERMGNTIENSNTLSLNGNLRMEKLYNKVPYLKKLNRGSRSRGKGNKGSARRGATGNNSKKEADSTKKDRQIAKAVMDQTLKFLMMWKDASVTYSQSKGNLMPGFYPEPGALGNNWSQMAPGIGYVFGWENDITKYANHTQWLSTDSSMNTLNFNKYTTNLNARATLEPFKDLRIELNATRTYSYTRESYYKYDDEFGAFQEYTPMERGSFSMSFFTFSTAFDKIADDNSTKTYQNMKDYRLRMADRLAEGNVYWDGQHIDSTGFPTGYSSSSQDVLHGAFVAAYTNRSPETIPLNYFPVIPFPNWRITYKGLSKIPALRKIFKNVTITHSYRSAYSIGSYVSNVEFEDIREMGHPSALNANGDFINQYDMSLLSISEQFSPLIKLDMTWNNSLLTNLEFKKSRNLSLSFVNNQLTEVASNEYVFGVGYRIKNVKFSIKTLGSKGTKKQMNSD